MAGVTGLGKSVKSSSSSKMKVVFLAFIAHVLDATRTCVCVCGGGGFKREGEGVCFKGN